MYKKAIIGIIFVGLCVVGCGNEETPTPSPEPTVVAEETQAPEVSDVPTADSTVQSDVKLPDGFKEATAEEIASVPDQEAFSIKFTDVLINKLNIPDTPQSMIVGNITDNSTTANLYDMTLDVFVSYQNGNPVLVSGSYVMNEWTVLFACDPYDKDKMYYMMDALKDETDIYDYHTGELSQPKTRDPKSSEERMQDFEDELDRIDKESTEEMQKAVDEFKKKQGQQ